MSLSGKAVDRIFERLTATYGRSFVMQWDGVPVSDVKTVWAHELAGFGQSKEQLGCIAWALENLPDTPPNAIKFRNLCRQAPAVPVPQLETPRADPERVAEALQKLAPMRVRTDGGAGDGKAWADAILARAAAGERIKPYALMSARMACGLPVGRGA